MNIPTSFREFVASLASSEPDPDRIARYIEVQGGTPIVEGNTAHFIAAAEPRRIVGVGGEWNGWDARRALMQPIGGGLWHYQQEFAPDARLDYLLATMPQSARANAGEELSEAMTMSRDPFNPRLGMSGLGDRSALAMPGYRRPAIIERRAGQYSGMLVKGEMESVVLGQVRPYTVYAPQGYHLDGPPLPAIYFHDGGDYLKFGAAPTILDNLIADHTIPKVVAVFVPPLDRWAEYDCNDEYVSFFADELVAEVESNFNLIADPGQRAIIGPSMGGLISLYIAAQRPEVFGMVGTQSSVMAKRSGVGFDARKAYAATPPLPLKLHLAVGTYETCYGLDAQGNCKDILTPMRELHEVLVQHAYPLQYSEHHYGHSWALWRDDLAAALTFFFAR